MKSAYLAEIGMELLEGSVLSYLATVEESTIPQICAHLFPDRPPVTNKDHVYGLMYHVLHIAAERGKVVHVPKTWMWSLAYTPST